MRTVATTTVLILTGLTMLAADDFQAVFMVDKKTLGVKGANPYFNLTPGYTLEYQHGSASDTITVLPETKVIDGVETRAVEHRETKNGKLAEVTRDYYAIDSVTNDVYYFGEEVDVIKDGKIVDHEGTWLAGVKGDVLANAREGVVPQPRPEREAQERPHEQHAGPGQRQSFPPGSAGLEVAQER